MYNAKYVIPGLAVFVGIFTMPFWLNFAELSGEFGRIQVSGSGSAQGADRARRPDRGCGRCLH